MSSASIPLGKTPEQENAETAVIENAKWVDNVLWSTSLLGLLILLVKIAGKREFKWQDVTLDISYAWIIFLVLAAAHLYASALLIKAVRRFWENSDALARRRLYDKITATGGIFVRGLVARTRYRGRNVRYQMSYKDPSAWLSLIGFLLLIIAIAPKWRDRYFFEYLVLGAFIAQINWVIGTHWVVALSDLTDETPDGTSAYFETLDGSGLRILAFNSGGYSFTEVSWFALPFWLLINSVGLVISIPYRIYEEIWMRRTGQKR